MSSKNGGYVNTRLISRKKLGLFIILLVFEKNCGFNKIHFDVQVSFVFNIKAMLLKVIKTESLISKSLRCHKFLISLKAFYIINYEYAN